MSISHKGAPKNPIADHMVWMKKVDAVRPLKSEEDYEKEWRPRSDLVINGVEMTLYGTPQEDLTRSETADYMMAKAASRIYDAMIKEQLDEAGKEDAGVAQGARIVHQQGDVLQEGNGAGVVLAGQDHPAQDGDSGRDPG